MNRMTKDEILALEPGPEMHDLVAIHVFERKMCPTHLSLYCCGRGGGDWSIHWSAMEELVNYILANKGESCNLEMSLITDMGEWECMFALEGWAASYARAAGKDAPEAVCKAALLAKLEAE